MADGSDKPVRLHPDGVYVGLSMLDYVNDPAISGSGLKKLLVSAPDFKWELPALKNPLYTAPETDDRRLGTLVHAAVLEGMDAFRDRYFVEPTFVDDEQLIRTADDAKNWLAAHGQKKTGRKAELFERVRGHWQVLKLNGADDERDGAPIFLDEFIEDLTRAGNGRREMIKSKAMAYVLQVESFVRAWPEAAALLSTGLPEVSIFWTENGVRYKARIDWLSAAAVVDVKKFGQPPMRGRSLRQQLQREIVSYCYDIQAVHNVRAALQIPLLIKSGADVVATGGGASAALQQLEHIADAIMVSPPDFHWLFLRTPGPPQGYIKRFPADCKRWSHCEFEIDTAIEQLKAYRATCGDELNAEAPWVDAGVGDWDDDDIPEWGWEIAR